MKRNILLSLVCLFVTITLQALPITKHQATKIAASFVSNTLHHNSSSLRLSLATSGEDIQPYYVFNIGNDEGFVIVSGDDATDEVLGYSYKGSFNADNTPENMKAMLEGYAQDIKKIQKLNIPTRMYANTDVDTLAAIPALVTSHWDQKKPFNNQCPMSKNGKSHRPTGCVATAMAQVMYYHKWPQEETSAIKGYSYKDPEIYGGDGSLKTEEPLEPTTFDWDSMLDVYENEEYDEKSADAVAKLLNYVGHSVEMMYGVKASAAFSEDIPVALVHSFGYKNTAHIIYREDYSTQKEWDSVIYNELKEHRPIVYSGITKLGSGHQFVCDGYENKCFHINWGWSGESDGFFKLSVLDPYNQGIGGAGTGSSFSELQTAIVGIQKPIDDDIVCAEDIFVNEANEQLLKISLNNKRDNYTSIQLDLHLPEGVEIVNNTEDVSMISFNEKRSELGDHVASINKMADGNYRIVAYSPQNSIITGKEGVLITVTIKASDALSKGCYEAEINNVITCDKELVTREIQGSKFNVNIKIPSVIETIESEVTKNRAIYTIEGVRIERNQEQLEKGLYIINGKKRLIK